ncbi:PTI1-like tyrosine-protein kinase 2 [Magnolia sinica]|uniref:PTI1-like tyrosine-protein kinase 2 n=1 Tax=Magnolia sinica TaxID=86752 RepID=UPI00265B68E1|nr:PTI1-like tyrosine-protein kinase 2 [Magnolia sinica]
MIKGQAVTDFIAEFTTLNGNIKAEEALAATPVLSPAKDLESERRWILYVDRSSNAMRAGAGIVLVTPDATTIQYAIRLSFRASNNEAEYESLLEGLRLAASLGVQSLEVRCDSQLVVNYISTEYEAKETRMVTYLVEARKLIKSLIITLHPKSGSHGGVSKLDWETRMRIALEAARGLEYLHEYVSPPVIHRDFKSSNILLDKNFHAKVSDFGLAKLGSEKAGGHVSTRVLGTQGYVAPEYVLTGHLTTKSDVCSYGVVLLELLTGRVPVDMKRAPGEGVLVSWALPRLTDREKVVQIMDPSLEGQYSMKEVIQVAAIAAMCVQAEADYRPLMADVVQSLVDLVKHRKPTSKVGSCSSFHTTRSPTTPTARSPTASECGNAGF